MISRLILSLFSLLYLALGLFCLFYSEKAAKSMGFSWENTTGKIEFLTFYAGLELGLGIFFGICAWKKEWVPAAILLALISSIALALTRGLGIFIYKEVTPLTYTFLYFEIGMVVVAAVAQWKLENAV